MGQNKLKEEFVKFPESYNKVRKTYGATSAVLLFWGLLGLDTEEIGGYIATFEVQSPEAIPIALTLLVIYLGVRLYFEWKFFGYEINSEYQVDYRYHKSVKLPIIDYYLSHVLGLLAIIVFLLQEFMGANIIEKLALDIAPMVTLFMMPMIFLAILAKAMGYSDYSQDENKKIKYRSLIILAIIISVVFIISLSSFLVLYITTWVFIVLLCLLLLYSVYLALRKYKFS